MNQNTTPSKLFFASDYMEGAHPLILQRLMETNLLHTAGYYGKPAMPPMLTSIFLSAERKPTPL